MFLIYFLSLYFLRNILHSYNAIFIKMDFVLFTKQWLIYSLPFVSVRLAHNSAETYSPKGKIIMLILIGRVERVSMGKSTIDESTGETKPAKPNVSLLHNSTEDSESELDIVKLNLKDLVQIEAFKKAIGQTIRVPVSMWQADFGSGLYLKKGVLPTIVQNNAPPKPV